MGGVDIKASSRLQNTSRLLNFDGVQHKSKLLYTSCIIAAAELLLLTLAAHVDFCIDNNVHPVNTVNNVYKQETKCIYNETSMLILS